MKLTLNLVLALLSSAVLHAAPAPAPSRPNLLLIVADDLGYGDVGFNGGKVIATPNLDRLAATGVRLSDFRACPMCSPTRAGLLTGRWPLRFGIMRSVIPPWSTNGLPHTEKTLPELLAPAGYEQRAIIGKWHLGHARQEFLPLAHGFTFFYGHYNGAIDYFTHERDGETDWHRNERTVHEDGYSTDLLGAEAVRFIQAAPANQPWFLYLPFNAPHAPFQAKEADLKKYPQIKSSEHRAYAAMVACMDQAIGRVLAAVEARPDASNTLVLFFSDNGGVPKAGSSNRPWRGAKLNVYEGATRVCAAIRWPAGGLTGGGQFGGRIGYIDVLPTFLAAAGASCPQDLDGLNFLPALRGQPLPDRPWFSYVHQGEELLGSVNEGRWKLVAKGDFLSPKPALPPKLELYDLQADLGETTDVAARQSEVVGRLQEKLRAFVGLEKPGGTGYAAGQEGFRAPKDWVIKR